MGIEQLQSFFVGQVASSTADPAFKKIRIGALTEHLIVIVGFQKRCVALLKMKDQLLTGITNVRKYPDVYAATGNHKAVWLCSIVDF
jgi:hypothetical protein